MSYIRTQYDNDDADDAVDKVDYAMFCIRYVPCTLYRCSQLLLCCVCVVFFNISRTI